MSVVSKLACFHAHQKSARCLKYSWAGQDWCQLSVKLLTHIIGFGQQCELELVLHLCLGHSFFSSQLFSASRWKSNTNFCSAKLWQKALHASTIWSKVQVNPLELDHPPWIKPFKYYSHRCGAQVKCWRALTEEWGLATECSSSLTTWDVNIRGANWGPSPDSSSQNKVVLHLDKVVAASVFVCMCVPVCSHDIPGIVTQNINLPWRYTFCFLCALVTDAVCSDYSSQILCSLPHKHTPNMVELVCKS